MYDIEMNEMTPEFLECWNAARQYLHENLGHPVRWLRSHSRPPFLEHLSFILGNQLFYVRVIDVSGKVVGPGNINGLFRIANGCNGHACILPMKKWPSGEWTAISSDKLLLDAKTLEPIDPFSLVTDDLVEMTEWEIHDFSVQIVCEHIQKQGFELMSWCGDPEINPSIWFVGESQGPEFVVVCGAKNKSPNRPENFDSIVSECSWMSSIGHFASVGILNSRSPSPESPLWRGDAMTINFKGLQ